jgi:hypothetical protein
MQPLRKEKEWGRKTKKRIESPMMHPPRKNGYSEKARRKKHAYYQFVSVISSSYK